MSERICDRCQKALESGEWPFCPHGFPVVGLKQIGDEIDEINENVAHEPVRFTSKSEKRRYLKEHGLIEFVRHVGEPGSDKSKHTTRWTSVPLDEASRLKRWHEHEAELQAARQREDISCRA